MNKVNVLDLYCGAGGAAVGIQQACKQAGIKYSITGIDINDQKDYPFRMIQGDVLQVPSWWVSQFDFVWASPPCQAYSIDTIRWRKQGKEYPDLIDATRQIILQSRTPYVIENVPHAPIRHDLMLCGEMFNLRILRHRWFELEGLYIRQPMHFPHQRSIRKGSAHGVYGDHGGSGSWTQFRKAVRNSTYLAGKTHGLCEPSLHTWQTVMQTPWITDKKMITEAVPPAYSQYIFSNYLQNPNHVLADYGLG